jgi:antitoxin (DNA-binding transcriptional repressor) of toxin-antitoxin stability system
MKTISVRELQKCIKECVDHAQKACVVVTRHGKPSAILIGVEGRDWEELITRTAPELARHIPASPQTAKHKTEPADDTVPEPAPVQQPEEFMSKVRRFLPGL